MVQVLYLAVVLDQVIDHSSMILVFPLGLCAFLMSRIVRNIMLLQTVDVMGIFLILVYIYEKDMLLELNHCLRVKGFFLVTHFMQFREA
jgi:hypothetical protein